MKTNALTISHKTKQVVAHAHIIHGLLTAHAQNELEKSCTCARIVKQIIFFFRGEMRVNSSTFLL